MSLSQNIGNSHKRKGALAMQQQPTSTNPSPNPANPPFLQDSSLMTDFPQNHTGQRLNCAMPSSQGLQKRIRTRESSQRPGDVNLPSALKTLPLVIC